MEEVKKIIAREEKGASVKLSSTLHNFPNLSYYLKLGKRTAVYTPTSTHCSSSGLTRGIEPPHATTNYTSRKIFTTMQCVIGLKIRDPVDTCMLVRNLRRECTDAVIRKAA